MIEYEPEISISKIVQIIKSYTTYHLWKECFSHLKQYYWYKKYLWTKAYFICSIGNSNPETIKNNNIHNMNSNSCKNKKYHIRGICPVCGKTNLTYGKIILTKDNKIYQIVECENCDSSFKECFQNKKFIGYDNINLEID